jgi:hypothetical protein
MAQPKTAASAHSAQARTLRNKTITDLTEFRLIYRSGVGLLEGDDAKFF